MNETHDVAHADADDLDRRRFRWMFVSILLAAALWRVGYVLVFKRNDIPVGDQIYYSAQASTIANGNGYSYPFPPGGPGANHAPLTAAALSPVSWSYTGAVVYQRLLMALYGTAVVAGIGLVARRLFDRRIALVAAAIAAGYAAFWLNDVVIMSETFATAGVVAILWCAYAYRQRPSTRLAVAFGVAIGLAGLARAELLVVGGAVATVLIVGSLARARSARRQAQPATVPSFGRSVAHLALAGFCSVLVLAPWVVRNQVRFEDTTVISTQDGLTLIGANCPAAYEGREKGFWVIGCTDLVELPAGADQSEASTLYRNAAFDYIGDHLADVPGVVAARLGRGLSLWRVEQMSFYNTGEGRGVWGSRVAVVQFWLLVPAAVVGLRRWPSEMPRWPIYALFGTTLVMFALVYGLPRFRVPAEVAITLAAAVAIEHWLAVARRRIGASRSSRVAVRDQS